MLTVTENLTPVKEIAIIHLHKSITLNMVHKFDSS
jgi:hypothetical protein